MRLNISLFRGNRMLPSKLATWCKGEETLWYINTAVRQTDEKNQEKYTHGQIFNSLHTFFFLIGQIWRSLRTGHHRIRFRGCIKHMSAGLAAGLSSNYSNITELSGLAFEFSQQCFAVAQFLVLFIGENKCRSSPSKEVFRALHGRNLNRVQDVW